LPLIRCPKRPLNGAAFSDTGYMSTICVRYAYYTSSALQSRARELHGNRRIDRVVRPPAWLTGSSRTMRFQTQCGNVFKVAYILQCSCRHPAGVIIDREHVWIIVWIWVYPIYQQVHCSYMLNLLISNRVLTTFLFQIVFNMSHMFYFN